MDYYDEDYPFILDESFIDQLFSDDNDDNDQWVIDENFDDPLVVDESIMNEIIIPELYPW